MGGVFEKRGRETDEFKGGGLLAGFDYWPENRPIKYHSRGIKKSNIINVPKKS